MCEFEDGTDLLRLMEGTTFLWILSGNGSGRESGSVLSKGCDFFKRQKPKPFIPSCLRDHTHWLLGLTGLRPII